MAVSQPFPFSDPHTVEHVRRALETNSCSSVLALETQNPVSAAPSTEIPMATGDTGPRTESPVMTACITSGVPPATALPASTATNPSQPNEIEGSNQSSSASPCPESPQESGSDSPPEAPEAGFGNKSSHEAKPTTTGNFSFLAEGQIGSTTPCDQKVSAPATSGSANQILTTVVVQPIEQVPSTTISFHGSGNRAPPKATQTSLVQASTGSCLWAVGSSTTLFAFGLLGGWLVV